MAHKAKRKLQKNKPEVWFVPVRGSYLPISRQGWLMYLPFIGYLILTLVAGVRYSSSTAIAVSIIILSWLAAGLVMTYVAAKKS